MKWLYFRTTSGVDNDDGFISNNGTTNSTLRTSALLKYENLQAIIPFNEDADEFPNGGSAGDYYGIVMIFKTSMSPNNVNLGTTKYLASDKVFLEVSPNSSTSCESIINHIENNDGFITIADGVAKLCPGVLSVKFIEISQNHRTA